MFHPFFSVKNGWSPRKLPTCCSIHTESNFHSSSITRCPNWLVSFKLAVILNLFDKANCWARAKLMSLSLRSAESQQLSNYTTNENNYGQLRQMELIVVQITFCNSLHKGRGRDYPSRLWWVLYLYQYCRFRLRPEPQTAKSGTIC